jgi:membrane-bound ClpP family serine protease
MWVVAGVLLGVVVLSSLVGLHTGPHAHLFAGVIGVAAAVWFVLMAIDGRSAPVLWGLLAADLVIALGVGFTAWKGLTSGPPDVRHFPPLESAEGVALSDLSPEGIVQVRGEDWSASSVNGHVREGTRVQVLRVRGVRLEVWGEEIEALAPERPFSFQFDHGGELGA